MTTITEAHAESHSENGESSEHSEHPKHRIIVTNPIRKDVVQTRQFVCQIHSCRHIEVCALQSGYLDEIAVQEGQTVRAGEPMFNILPTLYQARLNTQIAEAQRIRIELENAKAIQARDFISPQAIALKTAELQRAEAEVSLAQAELSFTSVKAPFDGIVDRQLHQLGSLVEEGEILTTLSDNSVMWVYYNVPEARYLEYQSEVKREGSDHLQVELKLANGAIFPEQGVITTIEADFNNETGNIAFRADFPNPEGLLRNGQTGTILIHETLEDVIVIPQRATFEVLAKQYAYVVDEQGIVQQRDITVRTEKEDIFVIEEGLEEGDRIIVEGIREVRPGSKIDYEFIAPEELLANLKYHAE